MDDKKQYLNYLDKEMTIMGILSSFCIGALALIFNSIVGASSDKIYFSQIYECGSAYIYCGCIALLAAAALFYKQRSELAEYYGNISRAIEENKAHDLYNWINKAHEWDSWLWHDAAIACIWYWFFETIFAVLSIRNNFIVNHSIPLSLFSFLGIVFIYIIHAAIYRKYKDKDYPCREAICCCIEKQKNERVYK